MFSSAVFREKAITLTDLNYIASLVSLWMRGASSRPQTEVNVIPMLDLLCRSRGYAAPVEVESLEGVHDQWDVGQGLCGLGSMEHRTRDYRSGGFGHPVEYRSKRCGSGQGEDTGRGVRSRGHAFVQLTTCSQ